MLQLPDNFKQRALEALLEARKNYDGSDSAFAKTWNINSSVYSRIKNGEPTEGLLKDTHWLHIGRELGISTNERQWKMARTEVFTMIEQDIQFCKEYAKGRICVDDCGIGKTYSAKYLARTLKNCFYVDASQAKTKQAFVRLIARTIGIESLGRYNQVKADLKYYLKMLPNPVVIIDEAGDLEYMAFLELKELWNATEGACGWYLMGADGLRAKINRGISNKKVGFRELFSRYSERYTTIVPIDRREKTEFYKNMITQVLTANMSNIAKLNEVVRRCLTTDDLGNIGGLRRAESLLNIIS